MSRTATLHRLTLSLTLTLALLQAAPSVLAARRPAPRAVSSAQVKQARPGFIRRVINRLHPHRDPTVPRQLKAARKGAGYVVRRGVVGNHRYAIKSVDLQRGTVALQNPWGWANPKRLPVDKFLAMYDVFQVAEVPGK